MIFRPLVKEDISQIVEISQNFIDAWDSRMLGNGFENNLGGSGVFQGDKLVGYILWEIGLDFADLQMIFLLEEYRNKGYATQLIFQMETQVKNSAVGKILLEVREGNLPAISLYQKVGFLPLSVRKKYYPDGENCLVMIKEL